MQLSRQACGWELSEGSANVTADRQQALRFCLTEQGATQVDSVSGHRNGVCRDIGMAGRRSSASKRLPRGGMSKRRLVIRAVQVGRLAYSCRRSETGVLPLEDTLAVQAVLQHAAEQLGVTHAEAGG